LLSHSAIVSVESSFVAPTRIGGSGNSGLIDSPNARNRGRTGGSTKPPAVPGFHARVVPGRVDAVLIAPGSDALMTVQRAAGAGFRTRPP
jgi:hypothetical protein